MAGPGEPRGWNNGGTPPQEREDASQIDDLLNEAEQVLGEHLQRVEDSRRPNPDQPAKDYSTGHRYIPPAQDISGQLR